MKKYLIISILFISVCASQGAFTANDWEAHSYSLLINDIDGDLDYIYAAANTGIIAIDRLTDKMNTIVTHSDMFKDFPIGRIMADRFRKFNIYFTGREFIYHYDWFNDSLTRSRITGLKASGIERIGVDAHYVYVQYRETFMRIEKNAFASDSWERVFDTDNVQFKPVYDLGNQLYILPFYRYFDNIKYDFTCYYQYMNTVWAGTNGAGIYKININSGNETHLMHGTGSVDNQAIALDSNGNIWIAGLRTVAIASYNPSDCTFRYFPLKDNIHIPDNDIVSISCSEENILFGTNNGYAFFYSLTDSQFRDIKGIKGNVIFRSFPADNDIFIVSNNIGLGIIDVKSRTFEQKSSWYMPSVIDMERIGDTLYFISSNALYKADLQLNSIRQVHFDFPTFNVFQIDKWHNSIVVMDNAYIHLYEDTVWSSYPLIGFFGDIMGIDADSQYVWICGRDGLGRFSRNSKTWKIYNRENSSMPATFTYNIIVKDGMLYGATGKAFFRFYYTNPMIND